VIEQPWSADQFIGILAPAFTAGIVLPTGQASPPGVRAGSDVAPDALALHDPDETALFAGVHARVDLFVRNGLFAQTGLECHYLAGSGPLVQWQSGIGAAPLAPQRLRVTFEHAWVRGLRDRPVFGVDGAPPGRHVLRAGLHVAVTGALQVAVRGSSVLGRSRGVGVDAALVW
jgi:hypothetical protein